MTLLRPLLLLITLLPALPVTADTLRVAVAANFKSAFEVIAADFQQQSGHRVVAVYGATGKHYAQIHQGAPFDLFLAADRARPQRLEEDGRALAGSRFTYARGQLVLWSSDPRQVDPQGKVLTEGDFSHLAIANPRLAPYGRAARQLLEGLGLWDSLRGRLVRGESVGQAYQFVRSGNAQLGLLAYAQLVQPGQSPNGSHYLIPTHLYDPIEQQAVLLSDTPAARDLHRFLASPATRRLIGQYGYLPVEPNDAP